MYAVVNNHTKEVYCHWIGKDASESDHDPNNWTLIEMTPENSPARAGGKYDAEENVFYFEGELVK